MVVLNVKSILVCNCLLTSTCFSFEDLSPLAYMSLEVMISWCFFWKVLIKITKFGNDKSKISSSYPSLGFPNWPSNRINWLPQPTMDVNSLARKHKHYQKDFLLKHFYHFSFTLHTSIHRLSFAFKQTLANKSFH